MAGDNRTDKVEGLQAQVEVEPLPHSSVSELTIQAEAAAARLEKLEDDIESAVVDVNSRMAEISAVATAAIAAKTQISDQQAVIATKSDHIQKAQEHADTVRAGLDRALTAATQQATEAEGHRTRAQSSADSASTLAAEVRTLKGSIDADAAAISTQKKQAEDSTQITKSLADLAESVEARVEAYEKQLSELQVKCSNQLELIESLLPGAASAGLAHAFDARRKTFLWPMRIWHSIFVISLLTGIMLAGAGFYHAFLSGITPSYDELTRLLLIRLPVLALLAWLAMYSSHEAGLAKRLEEDYGYKSAAAASFLGFHKQMTEIGREVDGPLAILCTNTLATLATPPGRIYEKHALAASPAAEISRAVKSLPSNLEKAADRSIDKE